MGEKREFVRMVLPASEQYDVPAAMVRLAQRRVEHLKGRAFTLSLGMLLANAYMQGMNDAVDSVARSQLSKDAP